MDQKKEIIEQINFMKEAAPEEFFNILKNSLVIYLKSVISFGIKSKEASEAIKVIIEMKKILQQEHQLLNLILSSIDEIDLDETSDIIDILDALNEKTYLSYDEVLSEIETSCEMNENGRILRPRNGIDSLISNDSYKNKVLELIKKDA